MTFGKWIPFLYGVVILFFIVYWFLAVLLWLWARRQMRIALLKQEYPRALQILQRTPRLVRLASRNGSWWELQSDILLRLSRYDEALASAERAITLAPGSARNWLAKSYALLRLNQPVEAEVAARQALARVKNAQTWGSLGATLQAQYRIQPAIDAYRTALALIPASATTPPQLLSNLSFALSRLGRFDEALEVAERAMSEHPGGNGVLAQAQALVGLNRVDEAIALLDQQVGPGSAEQSQGIFTAIVYRRHDNTQALALAHGQAERAPSDARPWARVALAETRLGNLADAERALATGEALGQDDYLLLAARGALLLAYGQASEALRLADAALALAPLDVDVRAIRDEAQQALTMTHG